MTAGLLELHAVTKTFEGFTLGPLSYRLSPGRALGVLGPNGAGKTTLLNLLALQLRPTSGGLTHDGLPVTWGDVSWKARISYVRETPIFYDQFTVAATVRLASRLHALWDAELASRLLHRFGLDARRLVGTLSKGSRVKLGLVVALAHRAQWLLLDEPSAGLDPSARADLQRTLRELMHEGPGLGVLLSSHLFEDLDRVADDVVVLRHGRIAFQSTLEALRRLSVFRVPEPFEPPDSPDVALSWRESRRVCVAALRSSPVAATLRQAPGSTEDTSDVMPTIYHATEVRR